MEHGHRERVMSLSWSPDGEHLASAGFDGSVRIWGVRSRAEVGRLIASSSTVLFTSWSPRGDRLMSLTESALQVFDPLAMRELASVATTVGAEADVAWSPDGSLLALPLLDGSIALLDADARELSRLRGHSAKVSSVAWRPDGRALASAGWDRSVRVWNVPAREQQGASAEVPRGAVRVAWSPDGAALSSFVAVQRDVLLHAVEASERRTLATSAGVTALAWAPDGSHIAVGLADGGIEVHDRTGGSPRRPLGCGRFVDQLAWSRCGRWLAAVGFEERAVCLWDSLTNEAASLRAHRRPVIAIAWSPVRPSIASAGYDGAVRVSEVAPE